MNIFRLTLSIALLALTPFSAAAIDWNSIDLDKAWEGGTKLVKGVAGISEKEEIRIGREVAANLAARYGLVSDEKLNRYLNRVGWAAARISERPGLPYRFAVLKTEEVNAFAAPGGYIFVTQGLLKSLKNEAELAGVLAHEISHVTHKHIVKAIQKSNLMGAGVDFAAAASKNTELLDQVSDLSINMLMNGLGRKEELEADQVGTTLSGKVGYEPAALLHVVQDIQARHANDKTMIRFNKTHPAPEERIEVIEKTLRVLGWQTVQGPTLPERFQTHVRQLP